MKHLNAEEIISYVTLDTLDEGTKAFCRNVNGHIRSCPDCLGRLRRYLDIHDLYQEQNPGGDFSVFANELLETEFSMNENDREL